MHIKIQSIIENLSDYRLRTAIKEVAEAEKVGDFEDDSEFEKISREVCEVMGYESITEIRNFSYCMSRVASIRWATNSGQLSMNEFQVSAIENKLTSLHPEKYSILKEDLKVSDDTTVITILVGDGIGIDKEFKALVYNQEGSRSVKYRKLYSSDK